MLFLVIRRGQNPRNQTLWPFISNQESSSKDGVYMYLWPTLSTRCPIGQIEVSGLGALKEFYSQNF